MGFIVGTAVGTAVGFMLGAVALAAVLAVVRALRDAGGPRIVVPDYVPDAWLVTT